MFKRIISILLLFGTMFVTACVGDGGDAGFSGAVSLGSVGISGGAVGASASGIGISVFDSNNNKIYEAVTKANGAFSIPKDVVPPGTTYTFVPHNSQYQFSPESISIVVNSASDLSNSLYFHTLSVTPYIEGYVTDNNGQALFGVEVKLSDNGISVSPNNGVSVSIGENVDIMVGDSDGDGIVVSTTDVNGKYSFYSLPSKNREFKLTPAFDGWNINNTSMSSSASNPVSSSFVADPIPGLFQNRIFVGDAIVSSAADIAKFSIYTGIQGYLSISNSNLTNLAGLEHLKFVNGTVAIHNNPNLESLEGLNNLKQITNGLGISNNNSLKSISALSGLERIVVWSFLTSINIHGNPSLEAIDLPRLSSDPPTIDIYDNDSLKSIRMNSLISSAWVHIYNNLSLEELSFSALNNTGFVHIINNPLIKTIGTFSNLTFLEEMKIENNSSLQNLNGLENLYIAISDRTTIEIRNNNSLKDLHGFCSNAESINAKEIKIEGNAGLISLSGLEKTKKISQLTVNDNNSLINMTGLGALQTAGWITISGNDSLIDLTGMNNLNSIGNFYVYGNSKLLNLNGLDRLENVGADAIISNFSIVSNPSLLSLDGMPSLKKVKGLNIAYNNSLIDVDGLSSLQEIWNLTMRANSSLSLDSVWQVVNQIKANGGIVLETDIK